MSKSLVCCLVVFGCMACSLAVGENLSHASSVSDDQSDIVFENKNQKRQYERVLIGLQSMEPTGGAAANKDDWFVVGGSNGDQVTFNRFQGEQEVALRVAKFISETRNRGQWRIYSRASDSETAEAQLDHVKVRHEAWRQMEHTRMLSEQIVQRQQSQIANSYQQPFLSGTWLVTGATVTTIRPGFS